MNVSEIITAFGAYYLNSGQNMNNILRMLTQGAVTPSFMTPIKTEETITGCLPSLSGVLYNLSRKTGLLPIREYSFRTKSGNVT